MLFIPPQQFRKRRKPSHTPPTFHEGMKIQQVVTIGQPNIVLVVTSQELVFDGISVPAAFMAMTSNGIMESCIGVPTHGTNWIQLQFPANVALGAAWQVVGPMAGISPAMAWPQSGTVTT